MLEHGGECGSAGGADRGVLLLELLEDGRAEGAGRARKLLPEALSKSASAADGFGHTNHVAVLNDDLFELSEDVPKVPRGQLWGAR